MAPEPSWREIANRLGVNCVDRNRSSRPESHLFRCNLPIETAAANLRAKPGVVEVA